ncbi:MAG: prepilin-type N-terminal cleavage/methylation domain-containing protein [Vicinamibacterales bacterium]
MDEVKKGDAGFSLIEVIVATAILTTALLALAQVLTLGFAMAATSTASLVAREKAREAIESVHTARDTHTIQWAQIRNVGAPGACPVGTTGVGGGVFTNDEQVMLAPGPDGLVNTADDTGVEVNPGPDGEFGTADDVELSGQASGGSFVGYTRELAICDVDSNPDIRQIVVTIRFDGSNAYGERRRTYTLSTLISRFS